MSDAIEGGCVCGGVRYRAQGAPTLSMVCHCTFCQRRSGSAFAGVVFFDESQIEFLRQDAFTEYEHRSDESARSVLIRFCARCGTGYSHMAEVRPGFRALAVGTFDDPGRIRFDRHIWTRSRLPWVTLPADTPVFEQSSIVAPLTVPD